MQILQKQPQKNLLKLFIKVTVKKIYMKKIILTLGFLLFGSVANATCPAGTYYTTNGNNCIFVSPTNPLPVTGSISATSTAEATAAAPSYVEGTANPFSQTLTGNLRVTGVGGSFPVTGTFWQATQPVSAVSLPLPTGAATSALQSTINTTLGSPFQAGGSIANTSFGATQATAANLNATVVGTGTFAVQATLSAETTKVIGTVNQGTSPWVVSGAVTIAAAPLQPLGITPTDRTITSATGSSQTVAASNASRHGLIIQNTGNANCGVNPTGGTASIGGAGTLTLVPNGSYQPRIPSLSAITAICTAGQTLYAEEN